MARKGLMNNNIINKIAKVPNSVKKENNNKVEIINNVTP